MIDTYLSSKDKAALEVYLSGCQNVIGPLQGRPETVDEDGTTVPQAGDPEKWYAMARMGFIVPESEGIEQCPSEDAVLVLGVGF